MFVSMGPFTVQMYMQSTYIKVSSIRVLHAWSWNQALCTYSTYIYWRNSPTVSVCTCIRTVHTGPELCVLCRTYVQCWTWSVSTCWWSNSTWSLWATSRCWCRRHHLGCQCGSIYCTSVHAEYIKLHIHIHTLHAHNLFWIWHTCWPYWPTVSVHTHYIYWI